MNEPQMAVWCYSFGLPPVLQAPPNNRGFLEAGRAGTFSCAEPTESSQLIVSWQPGSRRRMNAPEWAHSV